MTPFSREVKETDMTINEFSMHVSAQDVQLALDCEARRAKEQGMNGIAKRQAAAALAIRNAEAAMTALRPEGHRLQARLVFDFVPDVNVVLRDDVREGRVDWIATHR